LGLVFLISRSAILCSRPQYHPARRLPYPTSLAILRDGERLKDNLNVNGVELQ